MNSRIEYHRNLIRGLRKHLKESELRPRNIFCLGCAIKVPLKAVLYPALGKIKKILSRGNLDIAIGNDAHVFESGKSVDLNRSLYRISLLRGRERQKVSSDIKRFKAQSAILLNSYMIDVRSQEVVDSLYNFFSLISKRRQSFCIGKGHTIQVSKVPEQKFIMADYLTPRGKGYYGVANNDSIVTVDFNLRHSDWLNVRISLNNALNDLYALGVYRDITIYPAYDSIYAGDNNLIKKNLKNYLYNFRKYNYRIVDLGPLNLGLEVVGSTVLGFSDKEPPRPSRLLPGQSLIVTRPIGDLAALVLYIIKQTGNSLTDNIRRLKIDVLSKMVRANIEIAKIISEYLPAKGEDFDTDRHITATKDISGEGLSAFEDLALKSKVDIYIKEIKLHTKECASLNVPNNTSNTNGPIIIAAHQRIAGEIIGRLEDIGCQPWVAGKVGLKNSRPVIYLERGLKKHHFIKYKSPSLFSSYKFV